nr:hypothetical protein HK105_007941 [Polyrhizophydium stewartii]
MPRVDGKPPRNAIIKSFFVRAQPDTAQPGARLVAVSPGTASLLDVDPVSLRSPLNLPLLAGTQLHAGATPFAQNYGGHQYGIYAGQLGDGRCVALGEVFGIKGDRWTLQLKGTGPTPFARSGDGWLTLRGAVVEFLVSEYLAAVGTTTEAGAILTRMAPTWIRFGTFELFHFRDERDKLKELADYCIATFFPEAIDQENDQQLASAAMLSPELLISTGNEEGAMFNAKSLEYDGDDDMDTHIKLFEAAEEPPKPAAGLATASGAPSPTPSSHPRASHAHQGGTPRLGGDDSHAGGDRRPSETHQGPRRTSHVGDPSKLAMDAIATNEQWQQQHQQQRFPSLASAQIFKKLVVPLNRYAIFFRLVVRRTANMVAHWQANGFVHGALSSGFMDSYDPEWTPNLADIDMQYRFEMQPLSVQWNLMRLGRTLSELVGEPWIAPCKPPETYPLDENMRLQADIASKLNQLRARTAPAFPSRRRVPLGCFFNASNGENIVREIGKEFESYFIDAFTDVMCRCSHAALSQKLGFLQRKDGDFERLIIPLLEILAETGVDYTLFFRSLCYFRCSDALFSRHITYEPEGRHSRDNLLAPPALGADELEPMTLLLKAIAKLHQEEEDDLARLPGPPLGGGAAGGRQAAGTLGQPQAAGLARAKGNKPMGSNEALRKVKRGGLPTAQSPGGSTHSLEGNGQGEGQRRVLSRGGALLASLDNLIGNKMQKDAHGDGDKPANAGNSKLAQAYAAGDEQRGDAHGDATASNDSLASSKDKLARSPAGGADRQAQPDKDTGSKRLNSTPLKDARSKAKQAIEDLTRLPSLSEVATTWKFWAHVYRSRLLNELPMTKRSPQGGLDVEEVLRMNRMRHINPRYTLRGWVLRDAVKAAETAQMPLVEEARAKAMRRGGMRRGPTAVGAGLAGAGEAGAGLAQSMAAWQLDAVRSGHAAPEIKGVIPEDAKLETSVSSSATDKPDKPLKTDGEVENKDVIRVLKVLVRDVWGDVAESSQGWLDEEDQRSTEAWMQEPPWTKCNIRTRLVS